MLPEGSQMIATEVASPFLAPLQADPGGGSVHRHPLRAAPGLGLRRPGLYEVVSLSKKRPYIFLGCFVVGILLTRQT